MSTATSGSAGPGGSHDVTDKPVQGGSRSSPGGKRRRVDSAQDADRNQAAPSPLPSDPADLTRDQHAICMARFNGPEDGNQAAEPSSSGPKFRRVQSWQQCPIGTMPGPVAGIGRLPELWGAPWQGAGARLSPRGHNGTVGRDNPAREHQAASTAAGGHQLAGHTGAAQTCSELRCAPARHAAEGVGGLSAGLSTADGAGEERTSPAAWCEGEAAAIEAVFARNATGPVVLETSAQHAAARSRDDDSSASLEAGYGALQNGGRDDYGLVSDREDSGPTTIRADGWTALRGTWSAWSHEAIARSCSVAGQ